MLWSICQPNLCSWEAIVGNAVSCRSTALFRLNTILFDFLLLDSNPHSDYTGFPNPDYGQALIGVYYRCLKPLFIPYLDSD